MGRKGGGARAARAAGRELGGRENVVRGVYNPPRWVHTWIASLTTSNVMVLE